MTASIAGHLLGWWALAPCRIVRRHARSKGHAVRARVGRETMRARHRLLRGWSQGTARLERADELPKHDLAGSTRGRVDMSVSIAWPPSPTRSPVTIADLFGEPPGPPADEAPSPTSLTGADVRAQLERIRRQVVRRIKSARARNLDPALPGNPQMAAGRARRSRTVSQFTRDATAFGYSLYRVIIVFRKTRAGAPS